MSARRFIVCTRREKQAWFWTPSGWTRNLNAARPYTESDALLREAQATANGERAYLETRESAWTSEGYTTAW